MSVLEKKGRNISNLSERDAEKSLGDQEAGKAWQAHPAWNFLGNARRGRNLSATMLTPLPVFFF
jgi:hypothetical protein